VHQSNNLLGGELMWPALQLTQKHTKEQHTFRGTKSSETDGEIV